MCRSAQNHSAHAVSPSINEIKSFSSCYTVYRRVHVTRMAHGEAVFVHEVFRRSFVTWKLLCQRHALPANLNNPGRVSWCIENPAETRSYKPPEQSEPGTQALPFYGRSIVAALSPTPARECQEISGHAEGFCYVSSCWIVMLA